ncbi:MAG: hypothetical protein GY822_27560 [Deltaproteobacteria bacterium]|nr:hypothetical protein [Deltaproteobacteria bacterium]
MNQQRALRQKRRQLEEQHRSLAKEYQGVKERVRDFTNRRFLNQGETLECRTLQRVKLHKKDALQKLEGDLRLLDKALQSSKSAPSA